MEQVTTASLWALALLACAIAARLGLVGEATAEGLFVALLMGASVSLTQGRRCGSC